MTVRDICEYIAMIGLTDFFNSVIPICHIRNEMYYIAFDMISRGDYYG